MKKGLSYLIESELEKAEIILAARSITDAIQKMAETVAKMDAEDVMPLTDPIRDMFGSEVANSFSDTVSQHLRDLADKIKDTKNAIGDAISQMESGESISDLDTMDGDTPEEEPVPAADVDVAAPEGDVPDDFNPFDPPSAAVPDMGGEDDAFDNKAAGRARKESVQSSRKPIVENDVASFFKEGANPDRIVAREFSTLVREGLSPVDAATKLSESYGISYNDIVEIISGFAKKN